jgi:hypothetical protein
MKDLRLTSSVPKWHFLMRNPSYEKLMITVTAMVCPALTATGASEADVKPKVFCPGIRAGVEMLHGAFGAVALLQTKK